jgi:hypothetical protein
LREANIFRRSTGFIVRQLNLSVTGCTEVLGETMEISGGDVRDGPIGKAVIGPGHDVIAGNRTRYRL